MEIEENYFLSPATAHNYWLDWAKGFPLSSEVVCGLEPPILPAIPVSSLQELLPVHFFFPLGQKSSQGERRMGEREAERPRSYAATQVLD